ncbi:MAG: anti-sigma factor [Bacteroidetes bacterium]|nr:anti-sigma factor [Bacteroidota bacterium]
MNVRDNYHQILLEKFFKKETSVEETRLLKEWFSHTESREPLSAFYKEKWEKASCCMDTSIQENMLSNLRKEINSQRVDHFNFNKVWKYAAIILFPVCVALGVRYYFVDSKFSIADNKDMVVNVAKGQKANLQLPDGTKVWLNSNSRIKYDKTYNKNNRIIALEGEAYFVVAKDKKRPFIVKANAVSIRAVGTTFNVKAYNDENTITTTLIEGKVNVSDSKLISDLLPNQKIIFNKKNHTFKKTQICDAKVASLWTNNQLVFQAETLEDIAKILGRIYNVQVVFDSEQIKQIRFSGTIKNNRLESVLQYIALTSPIHYDINDSIVTLRQNSNQKRRSYSRN